MANPANLYQITERTLNAFAEKKTPAIILLKALYLLLKGEGYPVREGWWPRLPTHLRESARQLINTPAPDSTSTQLVDICTEINQSLYNWISRETDIAIP